MEAAAGTDPGGYINDGVYELQPRLSLPLYYAQTTNDNVEGCIERVDSSWTTAGDSLVT
jgi:hypothetical protein